MDRGSHVVAGVKRTTVAYQPFRFRGSGHYAKRACNTRSVCVAPVERM